MNHFSVLLLILGVTLGSLHAVAAGSGGVYQGIISDFHSHIKGGMPLGDIISLMDKNNVDAMLIMRRDSERFNAGEDASLTTNEELIKFRQLHPKRIRIGLGLQIDSWFRQDQTILADIRKQAESGNFSLVGEIALHGGQGDREVPPSSPMFSETLRIASGQQLPVLVHQFHTADDDERQVLEVFRANPKLTIIWAHMCGFSKPDRIRELFKEFPLLLCDLAWLPKKRQIAGAGVVYDDSSFTPAWKDLIESYPDRFLVGVDLTTAGQYSEKYSRFVDRIRDALGGLSPEAARKVATENFHRILGD